MTYPTTRTEPGTHICTGRVSTLAPLLLLGKRQFVKPSYVQMQGGRGDRQLRFTLRLQSGGGHCGEREPS